MSGDTNNLNYIRFDVGHHLYTCHKNTILAGGQDSILAKLIAPEFDKRNSNLDYIIIDRDGKHFGTILNYLRDSRSLNLSAYSDIELDELTREVDYYCILDLLTLCENESIDRIAMKCKEIDINNRTTIVSEKSKLEIIYGDSTMIRLMSASIRKVIVISYKSLRRFHIDSWFEELIRLFCDFSKNVVYGFSALQGETPSRALTDFIVLFYDPKEDVIIKRVKAPNEQKFKAERDRYKSRIFKHWFANQT